MECTRGAPEVVVGLLDGPVASNEPALADANIRTVPGIPQSTCMPRRSPACEHGTLLATILCGVRHDPSPGICPNCSLLVRPIFTESVPEGAVLPNATAVELATAIWECVDAGARVLNLSVALGQPSARDERIVTEALDYASRSNAIVVAAAGNQGAIGGTAIIRHPGVIPVAACDLRGIPTEYSNLGGSIGRRGLCAPGEGMTSAAGRDSPLPRGTSIATSFVSGVIALLWSVFPVASAAELKLALTSANGRRRATIVPPLLDSWAAYKAMGTIYGR
jgi:subtilisin family serine protease